MKLMALLGAGALVAGTLVAAVPAEAQRYGYDRGYERGYDRGYDGRRDYGGARGYGYRGDRGYDRGYGYGYRGDDRGYGYRGGRGYGRSRVVCRIHRGYYGPERRCFRVRR